MPSTIFMIVWLPCRWGNTPLDEGRMCGNKNLMKLLEEAKAAQLSEFPYRAQEIAGTSSFFYNLFPTVNKT